MSPRRSRKQRQAAPIGPSKKEKLQGIIGVAVVVAFTALSIWAIRPGEYDYYGLTGGIASRQPKATVLVLASLAALFGSVVLFRKWAANGKGPKRQPWLGITHLTIVVVFVAVCFFWPGGILRHGPETPSSETPSVVTDFTVPELTEATLPEVTEPSVPEVTEPTVPEVTDATVVDVPEPTVPVP